MKPAARRIEEQARRTGANYQLELGGKSLLSLFLALAVVCGMFFAFGYTIGKHAIPASFRLGSAPVATANLQNLGAAAAPAPGVQPPNPQALGAAESDQTSASLTPPVAASTANPAPASATTEAQAPPAKTDASATATSMQETGVFEVQVFAGSQADAENLATALKAKGYPAAVVAPSATSTDDLYRVQVGPYLTNAEAQSMRSRLTADGYQAVIKP